MISEAIAVSLLFLGARAVPRTESPDGAVVVGQGGQFNSVRPPYFVFLNLTFKEVLQGG